VNISDYGAMQYTQMIVGLLTPPATMYIALCTAEPAPGGLASDLAEPVDATGYMRKSIASSGWALVASDTPVVTNNSAYVWTPTDADWTPVTHVALCTAVGTNQVWCWTEITPFTATVGKTYTLDVATLTIAVNGPPQNVTTV